MWFIGVEVEQETSAPPPKKNPGSAPAQVPIVSFGRVVRDKAELLWGREWAATNTNHWFPRQMTSEKRAQKFHTDDALLPRSG